MSKERCEAVKSLMKQTMAILESGSVGKGRGASLALTYLEDAYLRVDFHMRENGWIANSMPTPAARPVVVPQIAPNANAVAQIPRNTLRPAAAIPQLNTGLMNASQQAAAAQISRAQDDVQDDLNLLG